MSKQKRKRRWAVALCLMAAMVMALCLVGCGRTVDTDEYPGEPPSEGKTAFWAEFTPQEWKQFLDERVTPYVIITLTSLAALYLTVSPILAKVKSASESFDKSSGELKATNEAAAEDAKRSKARYIKMQKSVEETMEAVTTMMNAAIEKVQAVGAQVERQNTAMMEEVHKVYEMESNILRMGKLGFGEDSELVKKGIAAQIAMIGEEEAHDDPQT